MHKTDMDDLLNIVCVHRELESDLEFWEILKRSVSLAEGRYLLVVGSNERVAQVAACREKVLKSPGIELTLESAAQQHAYEKEIRSAGKKIIQNFTDAGISSVGVVGTDRGILKRDKSGALTVAEIGSLIGLTRSGVVSVLMTAGTDFERNVIDINPFLVALYIDLSLDHIGDNTKGQIILLVNKLNDTFAAKMDSGSLVDYNGRDDLQAGLPAVVRDRATAHPHVIRLLTPVKLGKAQGARIFL